MRLTVGHKLFLTLLLATGLLTAGMLTLVTWSFERGFEEFIENRRQERVESFIDRLAQFYAAEQSWELLQQNRQRWLELMFADFRSDTGEFPEWVKRKFNNDQDAAEDPPVKSRYTHQPVETRVMLLDADQNLLIGVADQLDRLKLLPIKLDNNVVGYLAVRPGPSWERKIEVEFLQQQTEKFIWIALAAVLLSALFAVLLARMLVKPLRQFTDGSKKLAAGQYAVRIPVQSQDEFGQLAQDFNGLAAALERTEAQRRQWVADISHELRTPLSILHGELEALQDGMRTLDQDAIDSLHTEVMRLNRLVDDLYQLSMSDLGSLSYREIPTDVAAILNESVAQLKPDFAEKSITVELQLPHRKIAPIQADPDRLAQLFRNLLNNSLRYTDPDGQLFIQLEQTGKHISIDLQDSSPAVPEQDLPHLFERFYRVETSRNRASGGAGLGLAICRNIVEAHAGQIHARPTSQGGLWIHIELPLQRESQQ